MTEQPPVPPGGYPPPQPPAGYQPPSPGAGWPPPPGQPVDDLPTEAYTSWIRRVGAYLIDYILVMIVAVISGVIAGLIDRVTSDATWTRITDVIFNLTPLAFLIWNEGYRQGTTGSSIGKSVLKFKVVSENSGQPMGFGSSLLRQITHVVDAVPFCVGYLFPLWTAKRQTLADKIMATVCLPLEQAAPEGTSGYELR